MSPLAIAPSLSLFDNASVPVADAVARHGVDATREWLAHAKATRAHASASLNDLHELVEEAGVQVPEHGAFLLAGRFLLVLSSQAPMPDLAYDEDGEIVFDWRRGKGRHLSVSLRDDGRLSYAARFSEYDKERGTKRFDHSIPKTVMGLLQRLAKAGA